MANLSADLNENDGQNEQRAADRADAETYVEARDADFVSQEQERREFEAGAEDGERAAMRREAEEEARKEAAMEASRPTFKVAMDLAKKALARGFPGTAAALAWEARAEAATPGQKRLAAALLRTTDAALVKARQ